MLYQRLSWYNVVRTTTKILEATALVFTIFLLKLNKFAIFGVVPGDLGTFSDI